LPGLFFVSTDVYKAQAHLHPFQKAYLGSVPLQKVPHTYQNPVVSNSE